MLNVFLSVQCIPFIAAGFDLVNISSPIEATVRVYSTSTGNVVYGMPPEEIR